MASKVQIANKGLRRLGQAPIQNLTENTAAALAVNAVWDQVVDEVLAGHPWNCALARAALAAETATPVFEYAYQFALPSDPYCLRVWRAGQDPADPLPCKVEGRKLLCDESGPVYLLYIGRITDPELLSPWVADVISNEIAFEVAYQLTGSTEKEANARKLADMAWKRARSMDGQEGTPDAPLADDFLASRA
jgi:hypothetical protein